MRNMSYFVFGAVVLALFAGTLVAIQGAATNNVAASGANPTRWAGASASSNNTQGGNVSLMNLTVTSLTTRWAVYYGNISGSIILSTSTGNANIFAWYPTTSTGTVCVSTGNANAFTTPLNASAATIDTNWVFDTATDRAAVTQNASNCTLVISTGTVTGVTEWRHMGNSTYYTCAITSDGATTKAATSFCTNITNAGRWFGSSTGTANYELMIPTAVGTVETYYFYAELA